MFESWPLRHSKLYQHIVEHKRGRKALKRHRLSKEARKVARLSDRQVLRHKDCILQSQAPPSFFLSTKVGRSWWLLVVPYDKSFVSFSVGWKAIFEQGCVEFPFFIFACLLKIDLSLLLVVLEVRITEDQKWERWNKSDINHLDESSFTRKHPKDPKDTHL